MNRNYWLQEKIFTCSETIFDIAALEDKVSKSEREINQDSFWTNNPNAQSILNKLSKDKKKLEHFNALKSSLEHLESFLELSKSDASILEDEELVKESEVLFKAFLSDLNKLELESLLSGKYDDHAAIFSINAGAGGTDSQDWTQMLLRMYCRWFDKKKYKYHIIEESPGDEAGLKSVTIMVSGDYAYGYLNCENGVHRLVRQSPFNANNKRQTSFAAVTVIPQIETSDSVQIDQKDLRIDTFRASGAGGQHVNKTDSAVRITHIPTGIVASSQDSRSQGANKDTAMKILSSRLLILMEEQQKETLSDIKGDSVDIAWGNQIRSYVLHPYKLIKDLRTHVESSDVQKILDGDLDQYVDAMLRAKQTSSV